mgnify:CR=1 FL=1
MVEVYIREKMFNKIKILENINISLKEGEFLSIIGPSGCGKTTLLNLISSLDTNFNGTCKIYSSNIGFMFQDHRLIPWLNIKENLLIVSKNISSCPFSLNNFSQIVIIFLLLPLCLNISFNCVDSI